MKIQIRSLLLGLVSLISLLVSMLGYAYTHKPFTPENLVGLVSAFWQVFVALFIVAVAGGMGERLLKPGDVTGFTRTGLSLALGIPILSIGALIVASLVGTSAIALRAYLIALTIVLHRDMLCWLKSGFIAAAPLSYLIRNKNEQRYLLHDLGSYATTMEEIRALPADSKVIMLREARGLACRSNCNADEVMDRWYVTVHSYNTPEEILAAWREQGFTHLLLFRTGADFIRANNPRLTDADWNAFDTMLAHLPTSKVIGGYELYSSQAKP